MKRMVLLIIFILFASPVLAQGSIKLVYNVQRPGGDYTNLQVTNAKECARKCEVSSRCQAFDFHQSDSSCWLKDRVYQTRDYHGVVSGVKTSRNRGKSRTMAATMDLSFDVHRPGGDYTNFRAQNQKACASECLHDARCVAFDFTLADSICYMKNWEPPSRPYNGVVSGVKRRGRAVTVQASAQVRAVQSVLAEQNYNPGPTDGLMGRKTKLALRHYQRDYDLPVTGLIDEATLISLGIQRSSRPNPVPATEQKRVEYNPAPRTKVTQVSQGKVLKVGVFPWVLNGDGGSFATFLKENIHYRIQEFTTFKIKKSYYKLKGVPKLNVGDAWNFYSWNKPNVSLVQQLSREHGIDVAVLGTMDIHCRWSDNCQVRQMEIMLIDIKTGVITAEQGFSWDVDARDYIDASVSKVFSKFNLR